MAKRARALYRDRSTGRFVSKRKWKRSHGSSGKYIRNYIAILPEPEPEPRELTEEEIEELAEEFGEDFPDDFLPEEAEFDLGESEY